MSSEAQQDEEIHQPIESFHVSELHPESFLQAAISLKNQVVDATWTGEIKECVDPTVYTGLLGTALMCLRSYEVTGRSEDLRLCSEMVDTCTVLAGNFKRHITFLCGTAGIYALGAVVANHQADMARRNHFLGLFYEIASDQALPAGSEDGGFGISYELMHGRAGFLYSALFINKYLGAGTIPPEILDPIVEAILVGGRAGSSDNLDCPLMYRWYGTRYLGAAHGLAGILHLLLHFQLKPEDLDCVRKTIRCMVRNRFGHSGNYPSSEGNKRDRLVQWSHGAGGVAIMLCRAAQVFPDEREFRDAAIEAGEVVWERGLNNKIGLSDGIAGNAYTFLSLYRLTKERIYLERANAFGEFLYHNAHKLLACREMEMDINGGISNYSLFQGLAGIACLWFDLLISPDNARFPGFEL